MIRFFLVKWFEKLMCFYQIICLCKYIMNDIVNNVDSEACKVGKH